MPNIILYLILILILIMLLLLGVSVVLLVLYQILILLVLMLLWLVLYLVLVLYVYTLFMFIYVLVWYQIRSIVITNSSCNTIIIIIIIVWRLVRDIPSNTHNPHPIQSIQFIKRNLHNPFINPPISQHPPSILLTLLINQPLFLHPLQSSPNALHLLPHIPPIFFILSPYSFYLRL